MVEEMAQASLAALSKAQSLVPSTQHQVAHNCPVNPAPGDLTPYPGLGDLLCIRGRHVHRHTHTHISKTLKNTVFREQPCLGE